MGLWKISGGVGRSSLLILGLRWETAQRFNFDMTCGVGIKPLEKAFLFMFSIACVKDAYVANHLEISNGSHQWNVNFTRTTHDLKVDVFASFFILFYSFRLGRGGKVKLLGPLQEKPIDVRSFYIVLVPHDGSPFLWKCIC